MPATHSRYRVLEEIGAGGMGVVYRAHDERLDRDVALKALPPGSLADESARRRFHKEALTLSKLNHPNIAMVFDFDTEEGTDFLIEELVPGQPLSAMLGAGPLPESKIIHLGAQLADGLAAAHEQGVIHRDLKPANIRVTPEARLKILDFGLAKMLRKAAAGESEETASSSETQQVSGTLPYMAPEQLLNENLDARTDIWAAGCVLYEMATARRPFPGSGTVLSDEILHKVPTPPLRMNPEISFRLEEIILKCLERNPADRYRSAAELAVDLRRVRPDAAAQPLARPSPRLGLLPIVLTALLLAAVVSAVSYLALRRVAKSGLPAGRVMLAVLPVENLSGNPEQEYFSDGLTEELIARLGSLQPKRLGVIARTSAMRYKKTDKSIADIGRELGVDYVLESSVRRDSERARITVQLIQVSDQTHLWAESYERELASVLAVQSEISQRVARSLAVELLPAEQARLAHPPTVNPHAHDLYLKGRYHWNKRTPSDLRTARDYLVKATELDPSYALAYAGLADAYLILGAGNYAVLPPQEAMPQAESAAKRAIQLDASLAEPHATLGYMRFYFNWDWQSSESEFQTAIELNPSYATAHQWYALVLAGLGRRADALAEIRAAEKLDPLSLIISADVGAVLYLARMEDQAIRQLQKTLALDANFATAHFELALSYSQAGRHAEAIAEMKRAIELAPQEPFWNARLAAIYARAGHRSEALATLQELKSQFNGRYIPPSGLVVAYAALGDLDQAFYWLEKAYANREDIVTVLQVSPGLDPLRSDPRFHDLVQRMKFPQ